MILALLFSFAFHWFVDWVARRAPVMLISSCFRHSKATLPLSGHDFAWRTSVISAVHAIVTGLGSLIGFYMTPGLSDDLIESSSLFTINLVSYSVGYFLMDVIHMYLFSKTKGTVELIVHHVVIILCFSSSLYSGKYVGYSVVALLIEINSVFLHLRRISKYLCIPKENIFSRILCFANIGKCFHYNYHLQLRYVRAASFT
ncbi:TLC domain-containing protein 2 [Fasciola gigantica]|uniref:TLC domain-containing protein 2 n=1 Tax=Fasciola gigantica TaxID=46835 RepID=A0A504YAT1_FASGI|nr:TLC domain-containing protein 2 [Fasciola gigantica]